MKDIKNHDAKNLILKAALEEFAEKGMGNARTVEIAKRAGVATGLIHYYFESKENLYLEAIKAFCDSTSVDKIKIFPYPEKLNPLEKIQLITYGIVKWFFMIDTSNIIRFVHRIMAEENDGISRILEDYVFVDEQYLLTIINDGIEQGYFDVKAPSLAVFTIEDTMLSQLTRYSILKNSPVRDQFYNEDYESQLTEYFTESIIKLLLPRNSGVDIKPLPVNLTKMMDSILEICAEKINFGAFQVVIRVASKIFGITY